MTYAKQIWVPFVLGTLQVYTETSPRHTLIWSKQRLGKKRYFRRTVSLAHFILSDLSLMEWMTDAANRQVCEWFNLCEKKGLLAWVYILICMTLHMAASEACQDHAGSVHQSPKQTLSFRSNRVNKQLYLAYIDVGGRSICIVVLIIFVIPVPIKLSFPVPLGRCRASLLLWVTEIYWYFLRDL